MPDPVLTRVSQDIKLDVKVDLNIVMFKLSRADELLLQGLYACRQY